MFLSHKKSILYLEILKLQITFHLAVIGLADLIRAWYGPMPNFICAPMQVTRHTVYMVTAILWTVVALLKVWIVCIHKSVPSIDDDFIAAYVTRASFMMSFLFALVCIIIPQKPAIAYVSSVLLDHWSEHDKRYFTSYHWKLQWLCTGKYGPVEHESKRTFPIPEILLGLGWLSNVISAIMVYIQRRKLERLEGFAILSLGLSKKYPNKIPRSLESLIGNCSICGLVLVLAILSFKIK